MKNLLFYFYILCFIGLAFLAISQLIVGDSFIFLAVWLQLIWGPITILHCLFKFVETLENTGPVAIMYKISFSITVIYFLVAFIQTKVEIPMFEGAGDVMSFILLGVVPWLMFAFFTYIVHREVQEQSLEPH